MHLSCLSIRQIRTGTKAQSSMTISELLRSINTYPIPASIILEAGIKYNLDVDSEATKEVIESKDYKLAKADIYAYLAGAPNVTENEISFSFSEDQRNYFLSLSNSIKSELGVEDETTGQGFGWMGEDL